MVGQEHSATRSHCGHHRRQRQFANGYRQFEHGFRGIRRRPARPRRLAGRAQQLRLRNHLFLSGTPHQYSGRFLRRQRQPGIGLSYLSNTPGQPGEFIQYVSSPGAFAGNILVSSDLQLWGAEVNGAICLLRAGGFEFTALGGFRYANLRENLYIDSSSSNLNTGDFFTFNDQFSTRNQFYGGQVGARVNWQDRRLSIDATVKLAMGDTHQTVNIQGNSSADGNGFPGGFYAQSSNMGQTSGNSFSVIPSVELKLSYQFSPWWHYSSATTSCTGIKLSAPATKSTAIST